VLSLSCTSDPVWCLFGCMHLEPLCIVRVWFPVWMCLVFSVSRDKQMTRVGIIVVVRKRVHGRLFGTQLSC
jgi:hypothetical protein